MAVTIDELIDKAPDPWKPVIAQYGPALLAMGVDQLWAWITLIVNGKNTEAWTLILDGLDNPALTAEWADSLAGWKMLNKENAASIETQKGALLAFIKVLLYGVALPALGF